MRLETDRLVLDPLTEDDGDALHAAWTDEETLRHWHQPLTTTVEESRQRTKEEAEGGAAVFAIREKHAHDAIGFVGFVSRVEPHHQTAFGYLLRKEYWGKGYVAEAARAVMDYGFAELGIASAELWIYDGNAQSRRVAEKLGATYRGATVLFNVLKGARTTHVYEIRRPGAQLPPDVVRGIPVLAVDDVEEAVAWYRDRLGFTREWGGPTLASMVSPGWHPLCATVRLAAGPPSPSTVVFQVPEGLDEMAARLGATPEDHPWGLRVFKLTDPWGHVLIFETPTVSSPVRPSG